MKPPRVTAEPEDELAAMIRSSRVLDAALKRYWLGVLEHLTPSSRERLRQILGEEPPAPGKGPRSALPG